MSVIAPTQPTEATSQPSATARWYVLFAMMLVYALSIADRYVISTVLEPIRLELQLSDSGIAFLSGVSLAVFYVIFGFPISWLTDRSNRRNIIAVSIIVWSAMTVCSGLARSYGQLLLSRFGVGIGEAGGTPAANSIISDNFPTARRPMALTIFSLGAPIGAWVGSDIAGRIAEHHGWRSVFLALGVPGVLFGLLILLSIKEPRRGQLDLSTKRHPPTFLETMRFLWSQRSAAHVMAGGLLTALWGWGLMWWTPAFLMRSYQLSAGEAGSITGPIHLVGGIGATVITAWLLGRPSMADPRRIVWLLGIGIFVATGVSIAIYSTHSLPVATALFWLFIPAIYFYIGPGFGLINNLAEPRMRAVFCASLLFAANVGNLVVAPQLVGMLSDWFAPDHVANAASLRLALLCLAPTGFWAALHYIWAARRIVQDQERATGVGFVQVHSSE
ncbi:MAG: MFS transporter [Steroidobacteraceae bacterium]